MYLDLLKQRESPGLPFWRLNETEKIMTKVFNSKKQPSKLFLVYFDVKLQENSCACCI